MVRLLCNLTRADVFATPHVSDLDRLRGVSVSMKVMSWEDYCFWTSLIVILQR